MNKKTLTSVSVALAVLVAGYVGATAYTGNKVVAALEAQMAQVQEQLPFVHFVDTKIEKGLFSSTFSTGLRIGCEEGEGQPLLQIREHVAHGPLPGLAGFGAAVIDTQIILPDNAPKGLRDYVSGMKPDDIRTWLAYDDSYRVALNLPAVEVAESGVNLKWSGLRLTGTGQISGEAYSAEIAMPKLEVNLHSEKELGFKVVDLSARAESQGSGSIWAQPGSRTLSIGSIDFQMTDEENAFSAQLARLNSTSESSLDKDFLNIATTTTSGFSLKAGKDAKPFPLESIKIQESVKHVHVPSLQKLMDMYMAGLWSICAKPEAGAEQVVAGLAAAGQLLAHGLEAAVHITANHESSSAELSYALAVGDYAPPEDENFLESIPALLAALNVKLDARAPLAWIKRVDAFINELNLAQVEADDEDDEDEEAPVGIDAKLASLIDEKLLVRKEDEISASFVFEKGAATLNGEPLPLPFF
ncbi:MAG: YdgA family protein [Betaproteobacteria bacterium]|nr:YdgA family protein [Betaproteobacteria bacterium]MCL2886178.1 YdgA family protein [Betaproteobacteria bacterium]